ncbi:ankyrin repeat-containing domain protein [Haematococcus lacustris]
MSIRLGSEQAGRPDRAPLFGARAVGQSLDELEFARSACAAAQAGALDKLQRILAAHPEAVHSDGTATGSSGYTPLHYAARAGHEEVVRLLLNRGALVDARTHAGQATALHRAAAQGHVPVLQLLLAAGADARLQDSDGETALHKAAAQGQRAACECLLAACPTSAAVLDRKGRTPGQRTGSSTAALAFAAVPAATGS